MHSSSKANQTFHSMIDEDLHSDSDDSFHSCDYEQEDQQPATQPEEQKVESPFDSSYFRFQDNKNTDQPHH